MVRFGAGIAQADVEFGREGASYQDLVATLPDGSTLVVSGQYQQDAPVVASFLFGAPRAVPPNGSG